MTARPLVVLCRRMTATPYVAPHSPCQCSTLLQSFCIFARLQKQRYTYSIDVHVVDLIVVDLIVVDLIAVDGINDVAVDVDDNNNDDSVVAVPDYITFLVQLL
jgi:hypothetical protein